MTYQGCVGRRRPEHAGVVDADGPCMKTVSALLEDPASAILEIDRLVAKRLGKIFPPTISVPLAGSLIP